jgi:hypothetical protein
MSGLNCHWFVIIPFFATSYKSKWMQAASG